MGHCQIKTFSPSSHQPPARTLTDPAGFAAKAPIAFPHNKPSHRTTANLEHITAKKTTGSRALCSRLSQSFPTNNLKSKNFHGALETRHHDSCCLPAVESPGVRK
uniref:Uncharacterized protein n=1 Tax=Anguilla anguilla TaxID=7936 RepID=A0A0E9X812_ANGAN